MTVPSIPEVQAHLVAVRARADLELRDRIVVVWSPKGGVGKTMLATELAMVLGGVLVDLDWDAGGASRAMGYFHERFATAPLLDALRNERGPRPWRRSNRPDLIPSHPELETEGFPHTLVRDSLLRWSKEWERVVVVDTHPGNGNIQFGAVSAADVIVSPVELATRELNATEAELQTLQGYPILLVPNMVNPNSSNAYMVDRLRLMAEKYNVPIGSVIKEYPWLMRRLLTTMVTAVEPSKRSVPFVWDIARVAEGVLDYAAA